MLNALKSATNAAAVLAFSIALLVFACSCSNGVPAGRKGKVVTAGAPDTEFSSELNRRMYLSSVRIKVICKDESGSMGTGFAVSPRHVITALHVIDCEGEPPAFVFVVLRDGKSIPMWVDDPRIGGVDAVRLSVLEPLAMEFKTWVPTSDRAPLIGEDVCVVAGGMPGTYGIKKCGAVAFIQDGHFIVSMHIVPGNSGGAVFDSFGNVIGIVRAASFEPRREYYGVMILGSQWAHQLRVAMVTDEVASN